MSAAAQAAELALAEAELLGPIVDASTAALLVFALGGDNENGAAHALSRLAAMILYGAKNTGFVPTEEMEAAERMTQVAAELLRRERAARPRAKVST